MRFTGGLMLLLLLAGEAARAQDPASPGADAESASAWETLAEHLEVRQNVNVKRDIAQPAFVTFTNPAEGPTTYQVGLGVLAHLPSLPPGFDLDGLLDYQRNTASDFEQDFFKAGATGYWRALDIVASGQSPLVGVRTNFTRDGVRDSHGWQTALTYTHLFGGASRFPLPNRPHRMGARFELMYVPLVGVEVDHTLNASGLATKATIARALGQLSLALYPARARERRPVEILATYAYRHDLNDGAAEMGDSHGLFGFQANYFPVEGTFGEVGFGVSYLNGEDPDMGFVEQSYWQFGLKFRLTRR